MPVFLDNNQLLIKSVKMKINSLQTAQDNVPDFPDVLLFPTS